ncbi:MAG: DegT/DnrJ/EryC1/StrS family aminotransferase [Candidatus Gastranaerophilales bacterium]|nr:DegT/DnrJ/EryC1/StrS family aminotransferase [Candidatus Gastranaerophilales bacterium]
MTPINTARDLEIKTNIQKLIKEWYELKLARINFPFIHGHTAIPVFDKVFDEEELLMLSESCLDFKLTKGRFSRLYEAQMAKFFGIKNIILTISEQMAFHTVFQILSSSDLDSQSLLPGDEIISSPSIPEYIFNRTNITPVFIDIEPDTYNIDASLIQNAINSRTKGIFISHTAGNPSKIDEISEIAKNNGLWLIESCIDAIGSKFDNKYVGTFSDISIFGFGQNQQITTGEGGAVFINNTLFNKVELFSSAMTEMQASIGIAQLRKLPYFIDARKRNFYILLDGLKPFQNAFKLPEIQNKSEPCWAYFPIVIKKQAGFKKNELVKYLEKYNILTSPFLEFSVEKTRWASGKENFDHIANNGFKIGLSPSIGDEAFKYILSKIKEFIVNNE